MSEIEQIGDPRTIARSVVSASGLLHMLLLLVGLSAGFLLGRVGSSPTVVVVPPNHAGAASDSAVKPGFFEWLLGSRARASDLPAESDPLGYEPQEVSPEFLAAEKLLVDRSLSPDFHPLGYREAEVNVPTWNKIRTTSLPVLFSTGPTLEQTVEYLKNQTKLEFRFEWARLREAGLEPQQTAVILDLGSMNMESAIKRVLENVVSKHDNMPPSEPLAFDVQDGIVVITTKAGTLRKQVTFVYEIWDLLTREPRSGARLYAWTADPQEYADQLRQLIYDQVDANWEERGEGTDRIAEFDGNLLITASPAAHRDIEALLEQLRFAHRHRRWESRPAAR